MAKLQAEIKQNPNSVSSMNKLGVLYAKYTMLDQAEKQFQAVVAKQEYVPALVNLGNISYLRKDIKKATTYYERAYKKAPEDTTVIVNLARAYHEAENYGLVADLYDKLKSLDPELASRFSYLDMKGDESTRAADVSGAREVMIWGQE
jgi:Flp pilus assembly protein TadD